MQYQIEDLSPVRKKITVTVPVEEVDASLSATIAMYKTSVSFDGFRKGKVPSSIIEKRFRKEIYQEATTELVNVHINEIITETALSPISRIDFEGGELARGTEFTYAIMFDVLPEFDIPAYEGFTVEQEESEVNDDEIEKVVERLQRNLAVEVEVTDEKRLPKDHDIAVIDFIALDENNDIIPGIKADNFSLVLGEGQTLPDFEALVCTLTPGQKGEGKVTFPEDFFNPEFAGKTVTMRVTLNALKERKLPELDDAFAKKAGGFESMEKLRDSVRQSYVKSREDLHKADAQKAMLDGLIKLTDFPLPESMVTNNINMILGDMQSRLERQGKNLSALGKSEEALIEDARPEAEQRTRAQILLLSVAKKLELNVTEQEVDIQLHRMAMQGGQDFNAVKEYYTKHNLLFALRDRLLTDKAMEAMYAKANVVKIPAKKADEAAAEKADS